MKWSYILFLPAVVSLLWSLAIVVLKRHLTRAHLILSLMLLLEAFAITVLGVFFRGRAGSLFIYDFVFECIAMFCGPMYYVGVCSLTEPRGATLRQRHSFFIPILFVFGLTYGAFWLGPRRYEEMCYALREVGATWIDGDNAWNFMLFWDHWLFPVLLLAVCTWFIVASSRRLNIFRRRFNSFYADGNELKKVNIRDINVLTWCFLPLGVIVVLLIDLRPLYYKYWLIACSVLLTVIQFLTGRFVFRLDYDARFLAEYVRNPNSTTLNAE